MHVRSRTKYVKCFLLRWYTISFHIFTKIIQVLQRRFQDPASSTKLQLGFCLVSRSTVWRYTSGRDTWVAIFREQLSQKKRMQKYLATLISREGSDLEQK